ncbi:hypothetical protein DWZ57_14555 [Bacteroides fragilis]|nr:hypothetical protein DWZ57_14555 [Bacteroides fragilis]
MGEQRPCFKRRSSDATKIRRFFYLCKYFYIVLIINHLSILLAFSAQSQNCVSKKERSLHKGRSICLIYTNLPQNKSCIHSLP